MNKLFFASAALVALGLATPAALAADMRVAPAPAPLPAYTNWTGCYVGASAGTSSGHSDGFSTTAGTVALGAGPGGSNAVVAAGQQTTGSFSLSGFIGGGTLGCNWQAGAWVFGVEGDGSATNKSGQIFPSVTTVASSAGPLTVNQTDIRELQERWLVTARGRLGLTNFWWFGDKTLLYVTGGAAWAKIDASRWHTVNPIATGLQESNTRSGWTVGAGLEYALGYGWSAKSEFLYVDFGDFNVFTGCANVGSGCPVGLNTNQNVNLKDYVWRAGLNYKFW
jgi:outer membrane immunogenic protein